MNITKDNNEYNIMLNDNETSVALATADTYVDKNIIFNINNNFSNPIYEMETTPISKTTVIAKDSYSTIYTMVQQQKIFKSGYNLWTVADYASNTIILRSTVGHSIYTATITNENDVANITVTTEKLENNSSNATMETATVEETLAYLNIAILDLTEEEF